MAIIVLAGGQGKRMGQPKATLMWEGETLLERTVRQWHAALPEQRMITVGPAHYSCVVPDLTPDLGPLGGLLTGLGASSDEVNWVTGCDQPFLAPRLPGLLRERLGSYEVCLGEHEGYVQPFPGVYTKRLYSRLSRFLDGGDRRWRSFLALCNYRVLQDVLVQTVDPTLRSFTNVNTPADWTKVTQSK